MVAGNIGLLFSNDYLKISNMAEENFEIYSAQILGIAQPRVTNKSSTF